MGAQSRLLPPSVPYRFFVAAVIFHVVAWALLAASAEDVADFSGGPGLVLSAVHALTLGVFMMTVMGASFQLLPVATGMSLAAAWPCRAASWLYIPGITALLYGFAVGEHALMVGGGVISIAAMIIFAALVGDVLRRSRGKLKLPLMYSWGGLVSLLALTALGFAMIADQEHGFLPGVVDLRLAHMVIAVYGFMGMTVAGYSHILVPMFALSQAPDEAQGVTTFIFHAAVLTLAAGAALADNHNTLLMAAVGAVAVSVLHIRTMNKTLKQGMRKKLGLSFILIKGAWGFLPLSLVVGAAACSGLLGAGGVVLFVFLALFGWLLTFMLGVLQRIIPFLAAMNAGREGGTPPRLSDLADETPLKTHAVCHFSALALVSWGIVSGHSGTVLAGGLIGLIGSLAYLWFTLDVLRRFRKFRSNRESINTKQQLNKGAI